MVIELNDKKSIDSAITGGKGSSLAKMIQYGIPVPNGFVITTNVFNTFLEENNINKKITQILNSIKPDSNSDIEIASSLIKKMIIEGKINDNIINLVSSLFDNLNLSLVAVRSSATSEDSKTDSWAGELETFLNTDIENLFINIKNCWASLFSERAIVYRIEKELIEKDISVAVVIQEMIQSEISGIAFTVHPVSLRKDLMLIEAVWGLGEGIVSGQITPDSYLIDKYTNTVLRIKSVIQDEYLVLPKELKSIEWNKVPENLKSKVKLSYLQIQQLVDICKKIEDYYGMPQDIEWSFRNNTFFITQSRPITTL